MVSLLTDQHAKNLKPGDKSISDPAARGLHLFSSTEAGRGKWAFRFTSPISKKRREMGLGTYPNVSIRDARAKALALRRQVDEGLDPLELRRSQDVAAEATNAIPKFAEAARRLHKEKVPSFRNAKHSAQWINTLTHYVFPTLGERRVDTLRAADFADALRPIWLSKPETASRVRQRCDATMEWCAAHDYVVASPVRVVDKLLPSQPGKRERTTHHPAVPWRDIPSFINNVIRSGKVTQSKLALELLILTGARSGEIRGMRWEEVNIVDRIWTIPAARMKARVAHRIPLSEQAAALFSCVVAQRSDNGLVFRSRTGAPISDMAFTKLLHDHNVPSDVVNRAATAHGFRSSFRDWASENGYGRDLAEKALAHTIKSSTEAAYHRTDLLDQRRDMMANWASWCLGQ